MLGSSITIASSNTLTSTAAKDVLDNIILTIGTDGDGAVLLRSAVLNADTALTGVLIGTPDTTALAANSLIISNITADGDILIAVNDGGASKQMIFLDGSTGVTHLGKPGTPASATATGDVFVGGVLEVVNNINPTTATADLGTAAKPWRWLEISAGIEIASNIANFAINSVITSGSAAHTIKLRMDSNDVFVVGATGNGAGGIVNPTVGFFATTPAVKQTGYAVPTDLATCISSLTALRTALINYGLTTTV